MFGFNMQADLGTAMGTTAHGVLSMVLLLSWQVPHLPLILRLLRHAVHLWAVCKSPAVMCDQLIAVSGRRHGKREGIYTMY